MKNAKDFLLYLMVDSDVTCPEIKKQLITRIKDAVNEDAKLNIDQATVLIGLINETVAMNSNTVSIYQAISIAAWINSCH